MPFTMTADAVFDGFKYHISNSGGVNLQPHGIESAQMVVYNSPPYWITTDGADRRFNPVVTRLSLMQDSQEIERLEREELRNFFAFVQDHTDSNYRNVKYDQLWRQVYGVRQKQFDTYDSRANQKGTTILDATYCQNCGVVLPLRNLTIDHQKPQQGGAMEAMLRVFRALGLTVSTGSGQKNRFLQGQFAPFVGGQTTILSRGDRGSTPDRYTLSAKGARRLPARSCMQRLPICNRRDAVALAMM